ncbi:isochorismatase family cysteine hydrolase [Kribbella sp. NPDC005582]|uniref:cysteine hydrolase family protein n=1 Tax=Kribbella sp. NPDC005582 TaxID=3156893 RepID=UPI0033A75EBA
MNSDNAVLIVVDMQNGFISEKSAPIIPPVVDFVRQWRDAGRPYVLTRFLNSPGSLFERLIGWSRLETSPEIDLIPELQEFEDDAVAILDKPNLYSYFSAEGLELAESHGWTDFVVVGIATESCVLKTATDAFEHGWIPWVVTDAVYSHAGEEAHAAGLLVTSRFIGRKQLITSAEALTGDLYTPGATPRRAAS